MNDGISGDLRSLHRHLIRELLDPALDFFNVHYGEDPLRIVVELSMGPVGWRLTGARKSLSRNITEMIAPRDAIGVIIG